MNTRFTGAMIGIIVIAVFATAFIVYPTLPPTVVSHWGASGQANGWMPSAVGTFLLPVLMLLLWGLWWLLPRIDPIAPGYPSFRYVYDFIWILIVAFLAYVYALSLGANLGWRFDMLAAMAPAFAALFIVMGLVLPMLKRNWFVGIRTPWTLSSDAVWDKTHRLGRPLFVAAGLCALATLALPRPYGALAIAGPVLAAALVSVVYSYVLYAAEKRRGA